MAWWFRRANNRDVSTGPLACLFAHLTPITRSIAPHCLLAHSAALTRSLARSLTYLFLCFWNSEIFYAPESGYSEPYCIASSLSVLPGSRLEESRQRKSGFEASLSYFFVVVVVEKVSFFLQLFLCCLSPPPLFKRARIRRALRCA